MQNLNTIDGLRSGLDQDGCAYGRVTRERVDNVGEHLDRVETKINWILGNIGVQLFGFVLGVVLFVLNHLRLQ
jgi:hypothetical protein